jgi:cation diffusion facilitator family transporter
MLDDNTRVHPAGQRIVLTSTVVSVALFGGLAATFVVYGSRLALAQAADSFSDIFTASALLVSMHISAQPADEDHPIGHQRAEPIAALVAAVIAGVLAVEVVRDAVGALLVGAVPDLDLPLVGMFLLKVVAKTAVAAFAASRDRRHPSPALRALYVDARNDVAVGSVAVIGFFAARYGWPGLDAWLAIPVALWVGWAGFSLARENIALLMGSAPPETRRTELARVAGEVPGVRSVHRMRARHHGVELDVLLDVVVDAELSLRAAHAIGEAVERRLLEEPDVCHAVAHIDVSDP